MTSVVVQFHSRLRYFNSHPHEEDDLLQTMRYDCWLLFQLTSSRRGWLYARVKKFLLKVFQLTSSRRGWPPHCSVRWFGTTFQLTSSRRGWRHAELKLYQGEIFQLTSSRRGWPGIHHGIVLCDDISTHILTKRMTYSVLPAENWCGHFNSHPHEEDDSFHCEYIISHSYFNSHPHEEDDFVELVKCDSGFISTHILTKRMTPTCLFSSFIIGYFNSHPHEEDDVSFHRFC